MSSTSSVGTMDHPSRARSNRARREMLDDPENDRWSRCPVCGKLYADCDAYLRDEAVALGSSADDFCSRGTLRSRPTANERTRLIALPTLKENEE